MFKADSIPDIIHLVEEITFKHQQVQNKFWKFKASLFGGGTLFGLLKRVCFLSLSVTHFIEHRYP